MKAINIRNIKEIVAFLMVGAAGFEPATFSSQSWRATRLRYTPMQSHFHNTGRITYKRGSSKSIN